MERERENRRQGRGQGASRERGRALAAAGHHLQLYMLERYATHRRLFETPFLVEGWVRPRSPGHHLQIYMLQRFATHRRLFRTPFLVEGCVRAPRSMGASGPATAALAQALSARGRLGAALGDAAVAARLCEGGGASARPAPGGVALHIGGGGAYLRVWVSTGVRCARAPVCLAERPPARQVDRVGMLFWRSHRCARIIFSLKFEMGEWTADDCIKMLHEQARPPSALRGVARARAAGAPHS